MRKEVESYDTQAAEVTATKFLSVTDAQHNRVDVVPKLHGKVLKHRIKSREWSGSVGEELTKAKKVFRAVKPIIRTARSH